jgi:hypothetical protein
MQWWVPAFKLVYMWAVLRITGAGKRVGLRVREAGNRYGWRRPSYTHDRKTLLSTTFKSMYVLELVLSYPVLFAE